MKAKQVFEFQTGFERTGNPKKSLKLGYNDLYDYAEKTCAKNNIDLESFWEFYYNVQIESFDVQDLCDMFLETLVKYAPIEDQIDHISIALDDYIKLEES